MINEKQKIAKKKLSVKTTAEILGVTERYIRILYDSGKLSGHTAGKQRGVWIYSDSVVKYLEKKSNDGGYINYLVQCGIVQLSS